MVTPVRLRLSRQKGFSLQAHSRAVNGLPAVKVARPTLWGNYAGRRLRGAIAVDLFRSWVANEASEAWKGRIAPDLGGRNLACWCALDAPCHADILLELSNRPVCESVDA